MNEPANMTCVNSGEAYTMHEISHRSGLHSVRTLTKSSIVNVL